MILKTLVVDFYPPHLREAIIQLNQDNIIDIRYWLVDDEKKYTSDLPMHTSRMDNLEAEYSTGVQTAIPDEYYECSYRYLYPFMNIDNRWKPSTETSVYVHDFNLLLKIWYQVIVQNNIELMIMGNAPHGPIPFMAYVVAKTLGIKIIITEQEWFTQDRFMCFREIERIGCDYLDIDLDFKENVPSMMGGFRKTPFYMENLPDEILDTGRFRFGQTLKRMLNPHFFYRQMKKYNTLMGFKFMELLGYRAIELYLGKRFKKHRNKQCRPFDKKRKYVYFPLHVQPEMTTDTLGGIYEDQLLALERLDRILPDDWCIYVKENPAQSYYKRNEEFFLRLGMIRKAILVPPDTDTYELIEDSGFVATITGTAGWEAITAGKRCLCFGYAWYRSLAGVIAYRPDITIYDILSFDFTKEMFEKTYKRFYKSLFPGIVAGSEFSKLKKNFSVEENNAEVYFSLRSAIQNYDAGGEYESEGQGMDKENDASSSC